MRALSAVRKVFTVAGDHMLWGFVANAGTGNLFKVEGPMDSTQYQQILENNVQESVTKLKLRRSWVFQQDNDPETLLKVYKGIYAEEQV